jgi:hypothetical protein
MTQILQQVIKTIDNILLDDTRMTIATEANEVCNWQEKTIALLTEADSRSALNAEKNIMRLGENVYAAQSVQMIEVNI